MSNNQRIQQELAPPSLTDLYDDEDLFLEEGIGDDNNNNNRPPQEEKNKRHNKNKNKDFIINYRLPQRPDGQYKSRGVAVVEGLYEVESHAMQSQQSGGEVRVAESSPTAVTLVYPKSAENKEIRKRNKKARSIFIACFFSQLVTLCLFIAFLILRWQADQQAATASDDGLSSSSTTTTVLIGVNGTTFFPGRTNSTQSVDGLQGDYSSSNGNGDNDDDRVIDDDCVTSIQVDRSCYEEGDGIFVSFVNCNPREDDWVGIYYAENIFAPGVYRVTHWMWACGDQQCNDVVYSGNMTFYNIDSTGTFKAHLHRKTGTPKEMYLASTDEFNIEEDEDDC